VKAFESVQEPEPVTVQGKVLNHALGYVRTDERPDLRSFDWDNFRVYIRVAREGSFTRAARQLKVTQAAVSRRMARLEKTLGVRLFDRGTRGVNLTAEGGRLLNYANGAELMLARAVGSALESVRRVDGDCKIVMGDGLGSYWVPPFFAPFFETNPSIDLKLFTSQDLGNNQTPPFDIQVHYTHPLGG
jgi:DNA-binding transcriptional LysR family regulator